MTIRPVPKESAMYLHEMLGRARSEELLREAEEFRLARAARRATREARRTARRGGTEAAPHEAGPRPDGPARRGRRLRGLGAAG